MHVLGTQNNISVLLSFNLREDWFLRMKNTHFRLGFTRFLVISGPWAHHYFSRQAREVILMGPRTGNDQKTGKTRRKWVFFILRNQSALKLKKVVHITVYSLAENSPGKLFSSISQLLFSEFRWVKLNKSNLFSNFGILAWRQCCQKWRDHAKVASLDPLVAP